MCRYTLALLIAWVLAGNPSRACCATICESSLEALKRSQPDLLIPGSTHVLLDPSQAGYLVCTSVERYFKDEVIADLQPELDLIAKAQLVNFMRAGMAPDNAKYSYQLEGFRACKVWWGDSALLGLYFVPFDGVKVVATQKSSNAEQANPAAWLVEIHNLKKSRRYAEAIEKLKELRQKFPEAPQSRRALHEIFDIQVLINRAHFNKE